MFYNIYIYIYNPRSAAARRPRGSHRPSSAVIVIISYYKISYYIIQYHTIKYHSKYHTIKYHLQLLQNIILYYLKCLYKTLLKYTYCNVKYVMLKM